MKRLKIPAYLMILGLTTPLYAADACPDIGAIKSGILQGWLPLNSNYDTPASPDLVKQFKASASGFSVAEWSNDFEYGQGRCYYQSDVDVSLAKAEPQPIGNNWFLAGNRYQCKTSILGCGF